MGKFTRLLDTSSTASRQMLRWLYLSICLSLFCPESTKTQYGNHIQRTKQWDHNGTEHYPKYIKTTKNNRLKPDEKWTVRRRNKNFAHFQHKLKHFCLGVSQRASWLFAILCHKKLLLAYLLLTPWILLCVNFTKYVKLQRWNLNRNIS